MLGAAVSNNDCAAYDAVDNSCDRQRRRGAKRAWFAYFWKHAMKKTLLGILLATSVAAFAAAPEVVTLSDAVSCGR